MSTSIYHNPRCSKSRQTLELLREHGIEPEIIEYMKTPPDPGELRKLLSRLDLSAHELVRSGEKAFREQGLEQAGEEELIKAMSEEPRLIQRPIVVHHDRARLGRPAENVLELFT